MKNFKFNERDLKETKKKFKKCCPGIERAIITTVDGIQIVRKDSGKIFYYEKGKEIKL